LPSGFEVRLFAAEPSISKPLNMAFDHRGRMWLTQTVEYPYPAEDDQAARDAVMILEDKDGDGTADDITTFADRLNIPIGVLPLSDGCLCFSIPNIWLLRDTNDDGHCDGRHVVLGPFDTTRDTHGMINAFRAGGDGWIYACHGFNSWITPNVIARAAESGRFVISMMKSMNRRQRWRSGRRVVWLAQVLNPRTGVS
jgi:putative membrane-bound dehydrogenase-like protein